MKYGVLFLLFFIGNFCHAQYLNRAQVLVVENGEQIKNPWTGGLNSCQFSNIDLNLDGIKDLFVFDRVGNRILPFINEGIVNQSEYIYSPEYIYNFPEMDSWALLIDYNCDGKSDIFSYNQTYVSVHQNTSTDSNLEFEQVSNALTTDLGSILSTIYISYVDIPSITDVDGDGDIDILTFRESGGNIEYHKNMSMELYGNCDSLIFELQTNCWGDFFEGLNSYDFDACSEESSVNNQSIVKSSAHSGSSSLAIDIDGDNDKDIILGDVSFNNLNLLYNTGNSANAFMSSVNQNFPVGNGSSIPAEIKSFPASFYEDINNDNKRDLIVSPNIRNNSENFESIKTFINTGTDSAPIFEYSQNNFLQENTIDFGSNAYPSVIDYNNDGLKDILVGNYGYFSNGDRISQLALFENIGTASEPSFELINRDFGGISEIPLNTDINAPVSGLTPTHADLDNDGDIDLIVGSANGRLHYFKNTALLGENTEYSLETFNLFDIDLGQFAAPFLYDLNEDGLYDLVIGQLNGSLNYAPNNGTEEEPVFDELIPNLGGVSVSNDDGTYGYSIPFIYENEEGVQLLVGTESGRIYQYDDISNNLEGDFNLVSTFFKNIKDGEKTALVYEDFNNDNKRDLIVGNEGGGLHYFENDTVTNGTTNVKDNKFSFNVFPNPAKNELYLETDQHSKLTIYNLLGQQEDAFEFTGTKTIDITSYPKGTYIISIQQNQTNHWKKIIKQ